MGTAPNGYNTPKTNWTAGNVPTASDFNRIEMNIKAVEEGQRTIDPAQVPASNQGSLRQFLDWFANRIRAITGKANWYDAPSKTLEDLNTHINAAAPHSGHETPAGAQAKVNTHASSKQTHGISGSYYIAKTSRSDQLPAWDDIQSKPSSFAPSKHASTHKTGGTDVITPADIGAAVNVVYTATIQAANWSGSEAPFSQSVSVSGILSTDTPIIDVVMSGTYGTDIERSSQWNYVYRAVTGANSITFYAKTKPTIDLPVQIKVVR